MPRLWAALALLLGLHGALGHDLVPTPENVTVHCSDHRPRVSWNYGPQGPQGPQGPTLFTVELGGSGKSFVNQTHGHEFDLSDFVWSSEEQMFEFMFVEITATQGPNRSKPSRPTSFSYKLLTTVDVTCHLTFPSVNLVSDGQGATLMVENPVHFYKELKLIQDSDFNLFISTKNRTQDNPPCVEKKCKYYLDFPEDWDSCVNLTGIIQKGNEKIQVLHPEPVCATAPSGAVALWLVAILSVVILGVVIVALGLAICKVQAWVFPKTQTPQALVPNPLSQRLVFSSSLMVYSPVHVSESKPDLKLYDPESPSPESEEVLKPEDIREDAWYREDGDESGESTKTETVSINSFDSDEIPATNYERRTHDINMDLDGDTVKGYTG